MLGLKRSFRRVDENLELYKEYQRAYDDFHCYEELTEAEVIQKYEQIIKKQCIIIHKRDCMLDNIEFSWDAIRVRKERKIPEFMRKFVLTK